MLSLVVFVWMTLNKWLSVFSFVSGHYLDAPVKELSDRSLVAQWLVGWTRLLCGQSEINPG